MSNKPPISMRGMLSALRADRKAPPEIREERLRTMTGLRGTPALALSAWRGRSNNCYVVGIHEIGSADALESVPAVLIAVRRDDAGLASPIDIANLETAAAASAWVERMRAEGAAELHVHRLAEGADERAAMVADLTPDPAPADRAA